MAERRSEEPGSSVGAIPHDLPELRIGDAAAQDAQRRRRARARAARSEQPGRETDPSAKQEH